MEFRAKLPAPKFPFVLEHATPLMFIGSCFSTNMAAKCENAGFRVNANPFGTIFNPVSIAESIERIAQNKWMLQEELSEYNQQYFSFLHHTQFSSTTAEGALEKINSALSQSHTFLQEKPIVFVTLGTAWVYVLKNTEAIVANCHKIPQNQFIKRILSVSEVEEALDRIVRALKLVNEHSTVVFTVSPVRHLRDGMIENNRSKGVLLTALHQYLESNKTENLHYFPVYEWVIDELRDYRFFEADFMHPNQLAIDFVFEQFSACFFSPETQQLCKQFEKLNKARTHRTQQQGEATHNFAQSMLQHIETLKQTHPTLDFSAYSTHFKSLLTA